MGKCKDCEWFDRSIEEHEKAIEMIQELPIGKGGVGFCRCGLPRSILSLGEKESNIPGFIISQRGIWPFVSGLDYCSKFREREK